MNNVLEMLEKAAEKYPLKVALGEENKTIIYKDYLNQARVLGSAIANRTSATKSPIAVICDGTIESIVAFMGVVFSGNFYVPIDCSLPAVRLTMAINHVQPEMVIAMDGFQESLEQVNVVKYSDLASQEIHESDDNKLAIIKSNSTIFDPVFGIFTSGSTGVPKIVIKNHFSILEMALQFTEVFNMDDTSIFGNQAPFYFDVSSKDIYLSMNNGASLEILPRSFFTFPAKLVDYINTKKINTLVWSTFAIRLLTKFKVFRSTQLEGVRLVMFSGETMPGKVINYWRSHVDAVFVNLYGTTETTFNCSYYIVDDRVADDSSLPIGKAFKNTRIILLDEDKNVVKAGEKGEICVIGSTLSMGYYGDIDRTNQSFCQNPLNTMYKELIYRSGDLGYYDELGNLVFLSRKDHQIKHQGYRIELDEIEVVVNAMDEIYICCCIYDDVKEKIVLCYEATEAIDQKIFAQIKKHFPKYMLPNRLIHSEALPLNKNGKIDRMLLKENLFGNK